MRRWGRCVVGCLLFSGCQAQREPAPSRDSPAGATAPSDSDRQDRVAVLPSLPAAPVNPLRFADVAAEVGVDFTYRTGAIGRAYMVESTGGGGGWLDYDRDNEWDLYCCQGGDPTEAAVVQPDDALYRNAGAQHFQLATQPADLSRKAYGQGVSVADFDDDGFDDLYVANYGPNTLWHNCGDGTFEDVTAAAGVGDDHWSTSTAWGDLDGDGDLDLYVANYSDYDVYNPQVCAGHDGRRGVCDPLEVGFQSDVCYENIGDGRFADVTGAWGFNGVDDRSLGVVILDFNDDQQPDIFVANDVTANFLYLNRGPGEFVESGVVAGIAMNRAGDYQASMGVALGDYDADGRPDLYCTHFTDDSNTLYQNLGGGSFEDVTPFVGLHQPTLPYLGFGAVFEDFNADGRQELMVANGHIADWRSEGQMWKMRPQLFSWNGQSFAELTREAGPYFAQEFLGRAVAKADYDHDGDIDLLIVNQDDPAALLRNDSGRGHWLKLDFIGQRSNRRGIGVRVVLKCGGQINQTGWIAGGTSYCAAHEPTVYFGLAEATGPCELTIDWPSGITQTVSDVAVDQRLTITEPEDDAAEVQR